MEPTALEVSKKVSRAVDVALGDVFELDLML